MIFPDKSLAQRLEHRLMQDHQAYVEAYPQFADGQDCAMLKVGSGIAIATPLPYINSTYGMGFDSDLSVDMLRDIEDFFTSHHLTPQIEVSSLSPLRLMTQLGQAQYYPSKFKTAYYRILGDVVLAENDIIVLPLHEHQRELWVKTSLDVDGLDEADPITQLAFTNTYRQHTTCFLAMIDDEAVGACAVTVLDGSAILYFTSTREKYRKRGVQHAMIQARLAYAQDYGCEIAFTTTIPGNNSMRNVMRAGFQIAYTQMSMIKSMESDT